MNVLQIRDLRSFGDDKRSYYSEMFVVVTITKHHSHNGVVMRSPPPPLTSSLASSSSSAAAAAAAVGYVHVLAIVVPSFRCCQSRGSQTRRVIRPSFPLNCDRCENRCLRERNETAAHLDVMHYFASLSVGATGIWSGGRYRLSCTWSTRYPWNVLNPWKLCSVLYTYFVYKSTSCIPFLPLPYLSRFSNTLSISFF